MFNVFSLNLIGNKTEIKVGTAGSTDLSNVHLPALVTGYHG